MGDIDWGKTRETCERLFAYRKKQPWPPVVVKGEDWETLYNAQRAALDVLPEVEAAIEWSNALIQRIANSN